MTSPNFKNVSIFIGIDTHLKNWTVTIRANYLELKTFSMNPCASELSNYLIKHYPNGNFKIAYEAGFAGFTPFRHLNELGLNCIVVNPADIPSTGKEKAVKSDPIDSRKLARELEKGELKPIYIPNVSAEELRSLMRLRFRHVQNQTRLKNRIKGFLHNYGISIPNEFLTNTRWSNNFIIWLKNVSLASSAGTFSLNNLIDQLIESRQHLKDVLRQLRIEARNDNIAPIIFALCSVPGIAFITAMTLFTEIIDINRFSNFDKLASFVGLVPSIYSSADTEYSRGISFRHNKFLRPLIIEATWIAIRRDPALSLKYFQLCKSMPKNKAIIRIAKKLLGRIKHVWEKQEEYNFSLVA
ncbi:MAG: IS110 family transposase [Ignavibacteriae bacterium]|nr:IS110 family transposase [Ignavibacteriota bacterium]MCB9211842.1 IS110 family transposase [Ignavibacteriales bacterium]